MYLKRTIDHELDELMSALPAIAIDGPKGIGKTETCSRRGTLFAMDDAPQLNRVAADPQFKSAPSGTIILDEWQYLPSIWNNVRRAVDNDAAPGRFLLPGSATPNSNAQLHSGAGRIISLRMRPMALHERGLFTPQISFRQLLAGKKPPLTADCDFTIEDYLREALVSGFPGIRQLWDKSEHAWTIALESYIARICDRELEEAGIKVRRKEAMEAWLQAYAAATATTMSYNLIYAAASWGSKKAPSKATVNLFQEHLSRLWLLDPVPAWLPAYSPFSSLQQKPKHYLADPALAARLQNLELDQLLSPKFAVATGQIFESLVVLSIRVLAQACGGKVYHLRTGKGDHEIDLIVTGRGGKVLAIEVKLTAEPRDHDYRQLQWLSNKIPPDELVEKIIITPGGGAYRNLETGTAVIPLACLGL